MTPLAGAGSHAVCLAMASVSAPERQQVQSDAAGAGHAWNPAPGRRHAQAAILPVNEAVMPVRRVRCSACYHRRDRGGLPGVAAAQSGLLAADHDDASGAGAVLHPDQLGAGPEWQRTRQAGHP